MLNYRFFTFVDFDLRDGSEGGEVKRSALSLPIFDIFHTEREGNPAHQKLLVIKIRFPRFLLVFHFFFPRDLLRAILIVTA